MSLTVFDDIGEIPFALTGRVAIKLHMGETGNPNHVSPDEVRVLVNRIKESGAEPFLVDTTTLYRKDRFTKQGYEQVARQHGFGEFEVVIADDEEKRNVNGVFVAKAIASADSLMLLSHVTGHTTVGIGAAIKNLAMGCVVKDSKDWIHDPMRPQYNHLRCLKCGICARTCPLGLIKLETKVEVDRDGCPGCGRCIQACPMGALSLKPGGKVESFRRFGQAANAVMSLFDKENVFCINVLRNVTERCDCSSPSPAVCKDVGYLAGRDPLKVDLLTARILREKQANLNWETWDAFVRLAGAALR